MARFDVWDVVKLPFPYTNRPIQQRRPALVVAHHAVSDMPGLLWVLMITSAVHRRWPGDVVISNLAEAGLPAPSMVRGSKIATVEAKDAELIGRLPAADREAVAHSLSAALREATDRNW